MRFQSKCSKVFADLPEFQDELVDRRHPHFDVVDLGAQVPNLLFEIVLATLRISTFDLVERTVVIIVGQTVQQCAKRDQLDDDTLFLVAEHRNPLDHALDLHLHRRQASDMTLELHEPCIRADVTGTQFIQHIEKVAAVFTSSEVIQVAFQIDVERLHLPHKRGEALSRVDQDLGTCTQSCQIILQAARFRELAFHPFDERRLLPDKLPDVIQTLFLREGLPLLERGDHERQRRYGEAGKIPDDRLVLVQHLSVDRLPEARAVGRQADELVAARAQHSKR